jgi:hypothetical protein
MDKLEFPVAICPNCRVRGPMIVQDMGVLMEDDEAIGTDIIVCPECVTIINTHNDVEVEWFDAEDAKYFGYKVSEDGAE